MQIDLRNSGIQTLVTKLATEFFENQEIQLLQAETGIKFPLLKFNLREYNVLKQTYPFTPAGYDRIHIFFYKYCLTLDYVLSQLRAFDTLVRNLDNIGSESLFENLKIQMIHPSFIPWSVLENSTFKALTPDQRMIYSIRTWTTGNVPTGAAQDYLYKFPLISNLIALSQGLFLDDPITSVTKWVNYGPMSGSNTNHFNDPPFDPTLHDFHMAIRNIASGPAHINTEGGALNVNNNQDYHNIARNRNIPMLETVIPRLAYTTKKTGTLTILYSTLNDILREFQRVLGRTYMALRLDPGYFISNLTTGPLLGENMRCPDDSVPDLVDYNGNPLSTEDSYLVVNGHRYISSKVDPSKSGCRPKIEI